jgi:hypothetical protein
MKKNEPPVPKFSAIRNNTSVLEDNETIDLQNIANQGRCTGSHSTRGAYFY